MLSDEQSIYSAQVESRSRSPAHRGAFVRDVMAGVNISQFARPKDFPKLQLGDPLSVVVDRLAHSGFPVLPVVDGEDRLLGVVDLEEISLASQLPDMRPWILVADMMRTDVAPLAENDELDRAMQLFVENDLLALPIVDNLTARHVVGLARRFDIASTYLSYVHGQSQATATPGPPERRG